METASSLHQLEWAVAQRPRPGETVSGDRHVVLSHRRGVTLAVIDGVGHGPEAARAADLAVETFTLLPENTPLMHLQCCHLALAPTRGAVMTVAEFNQRDRTVTLCGVGNVEAVLFRAAAPAGTPARESALLRGGVLGSQLPAPYASLLPVHAGDLLVLASDGVRANFPREFAWRQDLPLLAEQLLERNFTGRDDALLLLARFRDPDDA